MISTKVKPLLERINSKTKIILIKRLPRVVRIGKSPYIASGFSAAVWAGRSLFIVPVNCSGRSASGVGGGGDASQSYIISSRRVDRSEERRVGEEGRARG